MSKIEQIAMEIAEPIAKSLGLEVVEVEYKKEGSEYYLRIYIDREDGSIGTDDCEAVSKPFSEEIDRIDPIDRAYFLEVCSPGIDRKLKRDKDFIRFIGNEVDVKLFSPIEGIKEFSGELTDYADDIATIVNKNKEYKINKKDAVYIKLAVKF